MVQAAVAALGISRWKPDIVVPALTTLLEESRHKAPRLLPALFGLAKGRDGPFRNWLRSAMRRFLLRAAVAKWIREFGPTQRNKPGFVNWKNSHQPGTVL